MTNKVITAIAQNIDTIFGNGCEIFINELAQNFQAPCFFILLLQSTQKQELDTLYFREQSFDIQYFPQSKNNVANEINEVADTLLMVLEYIDTEQGIINGIKMKYEVQDNVLHFFVNYNYHMRKQIAKEEYMENLKFIGKVKNNGNK